MLTKRNRQTVISDFIFTDIFVKQAADLSKSGRHHHVATAAPALFQSTSPSSSHKPIPCVATMSPVTLEHLHPRVQQPHETTSPPTPHLPGNKLYKDTNERMYNNSRYNSCMFSTCTNITAAASVTYPSLY